jgi:hypothetical protein
MGPSPSGVKGTKGPRPPPKLPGDEDARHEPSRASPCRSGAVYLPGHAISSGLHGPVIDEGSR